MKLSLKPHHLKRYKDIAWLFWKYGTSDLAKEFANDELQDGESIRPGAKGQPNPEELADDLERMGPTFIKFGQLLSSRPDLLPEPYLKALARLQDKVKLDELMAITSNIKNASVSDKDSLAASLVKFAC